VLFLCNVIVGLELYFSLTRKWLARKGKAGKANRRSIADHNQKILDDKLEILHGGTIAALNPRLQPVLES
jgi:hypothetical protein